MTGAEKPGEGNLARLFLCAGDLISAAVGGIRI